MSMWREKELGVPPQDVPKEAVDFRHAKEGPRGFKVGVRYGSQMGRAGSKRKLEEYAEQVEREQAEIDEAQAAAEGAAIGPVVKRVKANTLGVGGVSGRTWKAPGQRAGSLKNPKLSTSWDKKMADKAADKAYKERKAEAVAARKEKATAERKRREAAKARKEEAKAKAAIVQKVSTATAKRMMKSKKQKKKLKTAD